MAFIDFCCTLRLAHYAMGFKLDRLSGNSEGDDYCPILYLLFHLVNWTVLITRYFSNERESGLPGLAAKKGLLVNLFILFGGIEP
jgi:hypothetical protein